MSTETETETKKGELPDNFTASLESAVDEAIAADAAELENEKPAEGAEDVDGADEPDGDAESGEQEKQLPSKKGDEQPKRTDDDSQEAEDKDEDEEGDGEPEKPAAKSEIPDELLERAVKAGMSMKNARKFPDAESLSEAITLLGGSEGSGDGLGAEEGGEKKSAIDEALEQIPDLDPEEYDESLVNTVKSLKDIVRTQAQQLEALSQSKAGTWIEDQINTLGDVANTVRSDPGKKGALLKKFEVLKAGYRAVNDSISDEAVFQEAANSVLSDDLSKNREQAKADAAKKRSGQRVSRPSGQTNKPNPSVEEETAALLKEKFNL